MLTTLTNLPEALATNELEQFAKEVVKYQKFKTNAALKRINHSYSASKAQTLFNYGVSYLKYARKVSAAPKNFYTFIDKAVSTHIQPLTPSDDDKRRNSLKKYTTKEILPPVAKLDVVSKPLTSKFEYGIRFDDEIKVFKSQEEVAAFIAGVKYIGVFTGKVVHIEITDIPPNIIKAAAGVAPATRSAEA